ncbi:MAG: sulfotransferase domain-containing protein [Hellea sp.]|nr:sulfotransferase domain-containing protein [Hellea sp.]
MVNDLKNDNNFFPRPSFLIGGMQKCGTTALHHYLSLHPDIYMPEQKELHFFDDEDGVDWINPNYQNYESLFSAQERGQISGEATPIYTFWPESLERIAQYNSKLKIIILLRDPVERAYSHWSMERARNNETLSFSEAIREGRRRLDIANPVDWSWRLFSYVERGFYVPQIKKAFRLFGSSNVKIVSTEKLNSDRINCLSSIYHFLNVSLPTEHPKPIFLRPVKPLRGLENISYEDLSYLKNIYTNDWREARALLSNTSLF